VDQEIGAPLINANIVYLLIEYCDDINYKDSKGNTFLMKLHQFESLESNETEIINQSSKEVLTYKIEPVENFVKALIKKGIDINAKNNKGITALVKYSKCNTIVL